MEKKKKKIRANLVKLRKSAGYTQEEFAKQLGVTATHISDLENSKSNPSYGFIEELEMFCLKENIEITDMWELFK